MNAARPTRSDHQPDTPAATAAPGELAATPLLDGLLAMAPVGIGLFNHDLRYVRLNEALAAINGVPVADHIGRTVHEVVPCLAAAIEPVLRRVLETGTPCLDLDVRGETRAFPGEQRHWRASYYPIPANSGDRHGVGIVVTDVTERARAQAALRRSEQRFRSLVQNSSDITVVLDARGLLTYVSPSVERILGYQPEEWLGKSPFALMHPDDVERVGQAFARISPLPGLHQPIEFRLRCADGSWRYVEASANNLLDDPTVAGIVENVRDVTDRRRAEDALAFLSDAGNVLASSLDYETTLAQVARLAVPALADWCAVDIGGADASIHRLAVAALDPLKEAMVRQLRERYPFRPDWTTGVPQVMRSGEPELIAEVTETQLAASAQDPEHLTMLLALGMRSILRVPLVARGRTLGVISLISAESGRNYSDAHLSLAQSLARRAALAIDNARLYEEAQAALRARDQFFATISHDLRTPLTAIKAFAQILHRRAARTSGAGADVTLEALKTIDGATTKMMTLISEMLDLSRLQSGRPLELEREGTDLLALVRLEVAALQRTTDRHQITIETRLDDLVGDWDAARLGRVITNVVENALKYSPAGGPITLSVRCEQHGDGLCAVLTVRDAGIGIPAVDMPHVFERFHRGANVGRIEGTGVGLAGARQIVEQHGGTITITSTEGDGTTVTVRLPLSTPNAEPTADR